MRRKLSALVVLVLAVAVAVVAAVAFIPSLQQAVFDRAAERLFKNYPPAK